jgi:hypothetical protein
MIKFYDVKKTPNQMAKQLIKDRLDAVFYWSDSFPEEWEAMTEKEREAVSEALEKQVDRVERFLGKC